ncbi:polysaccharide lyase family 7 protein [Thalassomonas sp. M1454]|uniref:polysaccharide lyase family 7 protein n=1 Tax=Thalassomonas sp. M1454 TaxID=2594477 RepID=UPI001180C9C7|nr:polysaccharide lyase family 7 protein [Thalassomonas sp. M1454]TRX54501.1 cyclic nucleotide-binding protein [Thalassomonas sp. M1454]
MKNILSVIFIISYLTACGSGSSSKGNSAKNNATTDVASPAVISGELSKSINEDITTLITGTLSIEDTDINEQGFKIQENVSSKYGSFNLQQDGFWSYQLNTQNEEIQALPEGLSVKDEIKISSIDDTLSTIVITIAGVNDKATFSSGNNLDSLQIAKDTNVQMQAIITVTDIDTAQSLIIPQNNTQGKYGIFSIEANGSWYYKLSVSANEVYQLTFPNTLTDEFTINSLDGTQHTIKVEIFANEDSIPDPAPTLKTNELGIELNDWYLSVPTDVDGNGKSDSIKESVLSSGYSDEFFYVSDDNGLVFKCPPRGYKTSENTKYVRVELREMLRRENTSIKTQGVNLNNWVFSSAPGEDLVAAGGIDGKLTATLAVNSVTKTGENYQIGRVVIGQIHANDDEPIRLYYRKLPNNTKGSIYFAHEPIGESDDYYELIGSRSNDANDPTDGIALDEKFSYSIEVTGNMLTVKIIRDNKPNVVQTVDMTASGYDQGGQYMYFKAGVYNGNNSANDDEFTQATFYELKNSHDGYAFSEH